MAITVQMIKELRDATGAGVLDAKKALESSGGDFDQAAQILREKGLARAAKRADRATSEGRVEGRSQDGGSGLLVEVNCETDFVGRNEGFVNFASRVADHFVAVSKEGQPLEEVMSTPLADNSDLTPLVALQGLIATTGENMAVRRYARYDLGDSPGTIEVYVHPGNRVAVMLELNSKTPLVAADDEFTSLAHDLALHIAAMAPLCRVREEFPAEKLETRKADYRQRALREGKPERIVERIVEGRLRKFYEEMVLFEQPFVKDDEITVGKLLQQRSAALGEEITIPRFARFELGKDPD